MEAKSTKVYNYFGVLTQCNCIMGFWWRTIAMKKKQLINWRIISVLWLYVWIVTVVRGFVGRETYSERRPRAYTGAFEREPSSRTGNQVERRFEGFDWERELRGSKGTSDGYGRRGHRGREICMPKTYIFCSEEWMVCWVYLQRSGENTKLL